MKSTEITAFKSTDMSIWQTFCNGGRTYLMWVKQNKSKQKPILQKPQKIFLIENFVLLMIIGL